MKHRIVTQRSYLPSLLLLPVALAGVSACGGDNTGTGASTGASGDTASSSASSSSGSGGGASSSGSGGGASSSGSGGGASSSGSGSGASSSGSGGGVPSTATRPQLSGAEASNYTILKYLEKGGAIGSLVTDSWDPTAGVDLTGVSPTYTVAADNTGTHTSVGAAITAANLAGGAARRYILVKPGVYSEVVCVPSTAPPITLYGAGPDASQVTIVANHSNPEPKAAGAPANPCNPNAAALTYGTSGSATFAAYASGFQAKNLTFQNSYDETTYPGSNQSAVALMTQGDHLIFDNVRVLGNQDTLYVKTPSVTTVARAYFKGSYVEGDVDFIFGRGTLVIDGSTIKYLTARQGAKGGYTLAPSTAPGNTYGFLVINSDLTAEVGTPDGLIYLGRSWDEGVTSGTYMPGVSPNGQALLRDSTLGAQVRLADPWGTSTSSRPYDAAGNRFSEFGNTGPGSGKKGP